VRLRVRFLVYHPGSEKGTEEFVAGCSFLDGDPSPGLPPSHPPAPAPDSSLSFGYLKMHIVQSPQHFLIMSRKSVQVQEKEKD
jgi:hypothetical protein